MIKIETVNTDNRYVRIEGTSKLVCTELMIVITKMIENNMLSEDDRNVIKLITGLAFGIPYPLNYLLHIILYLSLYVYLSKIYFYFL